MCLNDQPWPATKNCDMDSAVVPYQFPSPHNSHVMSNFMSMPRWTANGHMSK